VRLNFWNKVKRCKHLEVGHYIDFGRCSTDGCSWFETRCLKCGVYIVHCGCGFENSMSGWPRKQHIRRERQRDLLVQRVLTSGPKMLY